MKKNLQLFTLMLCTAFATRAQTGTGLHFDGSNDNISRALVSSQTQQVTMEARVIWEGVSPSGRYIMYNGTNGTNGYGMFLASGSTSVAIKYGFATYTSTYTLPTGSLTLLSCVIVGANGLLLYANGSLVWSTFPPPATGPVESFAIGSDDAGSSCFNGTIEEVRFWNRIVCPAEIAHRANCSPFGNEPLLVAHYKFDQGVAGANNPTVTTLMDSSPSNFTATLNNFALTTGSISNWYAPAGSYSTVCTAAPNTLTLTPNPTIALCPGNSVTITATGAGSYTWNTGFVGATLVVTPTANTTYSALGQGGCYGMGTSVISVSAAPSVTVSTTAPTLCIGQTATLSGSGAASYTWNPGGAATSITVNPVVNTTYTINATGANSCTSSTTYTQLVTTCAGIAQYISNAGHLMVYPNPANEEVMVSVQNLSTEMIVEIKDFTGRIVQQTKMNSESEKISISTLAKGIYFLGLTENGRTVSSMKLIKL